MDIPSVIIFYTSRPSSRFDCTIPKQLKHALSTIGCLYQYNAKDCESDTWLTYRLQVSCQLLQSDSDGSGFILAHHTNAMYVLLAPAQFACVLFLNFF